MLILGCDAENAQRFSNMVTELRESYIAKKHPYAITKIASGSKAGKYKTYKGKPRKEIVRNAKKQLINYLSKYYTNLETKKPTFGSLLESMLSDIITEDNRAPKTSSTYKYGITTTNNHAFRISLNNKFIQLGLSADERSLLLGHSVEVNERHYSKIDSRRLNIISEKLT